MTAKLSVPAETVGASRPGPGRTRRRDAAPDATDRDPYSLAHDYVRGEMDAAEFVRRSRWNAERASGLHRWSRLLMHRGSA